MVADLGSRVVRGWLIRGCAIATLPIVFVLDCVGPSDQELSGGRKDSGTRDSTTGGSAGTGAGGGVGATGGTNVGATGGGATGGVSGAGAGGSSGCTPACTSALESCQSGSCVCKTPLVRCGSCVDTSVDPQNCGACGTKCTKGHVCNQGQCVCPAGTDLCTGTCRTRGTQNNCNISGQQCWGCNPSVIVGYDICINNFCKTWQDCPAGTSACANACVNEVTDWMNCGGCGIQCADSEICANGKCQPFRPAFGCSACPCVDECTELTGPVSRCCASPYTSGALLCVAGVDCPSTSG